MSVMLRTTNPAAAGEIDPGRDRRVPYVGQWVIYHCRPGEGFQGRLEAPAIVINVEDDDHIEIVIFRAGDDTITRFKVPRRTDQNTFNCWSFNEWDDRHYQRPTGVDERATAAEGKIGALRSDIDNLRSQIKSLESEIKRLQQHGRR